MSIKHPVLKYYGSKFRLASWIIEHFPKHRHYVEPFGGAANVLLVKPPSKLETYNDLNGDLLPENLFEASKRFLDVQIENRDAIKLITEMDAPDTLFYLDPPYVHSTRVAKKSYSHEMTDKQHREFADVLHDLKGFVILSGYPSKIYEELFERRGWKRSDKESVTIGHTKRIESIWLSPATAAALDETC